MTRDKGMKNTVDCIEMFCKSRERHLWLSYAGPRDFEKMQIPKKAAEQRAHFFLTTS
jgi:hypothetical protein